MSAEQEEFERTALEMLSNLEQARTRLLRRDEALHAELLQNERDSGAVRLTIELYRQAKGLPKRDTRLSNLPDQESLKFVHLTYRELGHVDKVLRWARDHDSVVVTKDIVATLTAAGVF